MIKEGTLQRGDIFILDNCSVHYLGDNVGMKSALKEMYDIDLVTLPPYHPELNPTELIFHILLERLRSRHSRCLSPTIFHFHEEMRCVLDEISFDDVYSAYRKQGCVS